MVTMCPSTARQIWVHLVEEMCVPSPPTSHVDYQTSMVAADYISCHVGEVVLEPTFGNTRI
jgi:hypothetical protein